MRKHARRLWLGDWQRADDEPTEARPVGPGADQDDTFVILPADDEAAKRRAEDRRKRRRAIASGAAIAALCFLAILLLSRGDDNQSTTAPPQLSASQSPQAQPQIPQPQTPQGAPPYGYGAPDITGLAATKAAKAALAKFPGSIERVTAGPGGGGYVVHVIQGDGNEVHVIVSDGFKVLGSDAGRFGGGVPPSSVSPQGGSTNSS